MTNLADSDRDRLDTATAELDPPFAVVDLDAFDANAADLLRRASGTSVRLASKSVRVRALIGRGLEAGLQGILAFTLPEARRSRSAALASNASRSTTANGGSSSAVAASSLVRSASARSVTATDASGRSVR